MWSYNTSKKEKKHYFPSYDDTQFAILCGMRFYAPQNDIPDYYVYDEDEKLFETVYGKELFKIYVENGGYVFDDCVNKGNDKISNETKEKNDEDDFYMMISRINNLLDNLINSINQLTSMVGGDKNER